MVLQELEMFLKDMCRKSLCFAAAHQRIGFEEGQLRAMTRLAVEAGFAEDAVKEAVSARLDLPEFRDTD